MEIIMNPYNSWKITLENCMNRTVNIKEKHNSEIQCKDNLKCKSYIIG